MSRPLGGITSLKLGVASSTGAAPTLEESGTEIPLLEDRSTYTEQIEWVGSAAQSVVHTLTFYTPLEYTMPESLSEAFDQGFVALVQFNSYNSTTLGWSPEALSDRALRIVSCTVSSGDKPSSRGYKEWVLSSTDGASCTLEEVVLSTDDDQVSDGNISVGI